MANLFTKTDLRQLWNQIVEMEGRGKYSPEEWQKSFDDFCRCILYDPKPIIRIDSLDQLEKGIVNSKVVLLNQAPTTVREDTPRPRQGVTSADKVTEMWKQKDASIKQGGRVSRANQDSVTASPVQNNPPEPQQSADNQWNRPNPPEGPMTAQEIRGTSHDFRIPRTQIQSQVPARRYNNEHTFIKPPVPMAKSDDQITLQEIFEQSRMKRTGPIPNVNADPVKFTSMLQQEAELQAKKQNIDSNGQQLSLQEIYEQNRMRRTLPGPNANMDPAKLKSMHNSEHDLQAKKQKMENNGEAKQETKQPIVDDKKEVNPIDDWLKDFNYDSTGGIAQEISDTSDFFKNLPNPSMVIGKTSMELKAALNNMQPEPILSKKGKKRSKKSKQ